MSKLLQLKAGQSIKIVATDTNFAQSETSPDDYLLHFEGHDKRAIFVMIRKRVLLDLFENLKKNFEAVRF